MDYKFLDKVIDQIVSETTIDYDKGRIYTPFPSSFKFFISSYLLSFIKHCEDVYGLNEQEIDYVWNEYKDIINDKIENNG